jgi:hypothetical protein
METTTSTAHLLCVASYVNSAQADLARMLLAMEHIPAYLDNAALVTWFWHYSNLTGGAKVVVSSLDTEQAAEVLSPASEPISVVPPPWTCVKCGERVDSSWATCWHCGASTDGEEDPNFYGQPVVLPFSLTCSPRTVSILLGVSGPLLYLLSHGSLSLLAVWFASVVPVLLLRTFWAADEDDMPRAEYLPDRAVADREAESVADGYTAIEETVLRAWQSAVLGLFFTPLAFYAIWILLWLKLPDEPLAPREQRRYFGAWAFSVAPMAFFAWWVTCLVRYAF